MSYNSGLKIIDKFIAPIIERALSLTPEELASSMQSKHTFLHALANLTRDRKILRDQILALLVAGRDTTASALSWVFYELARHPEITRKLRAEIVDTVGLDTAPTYQDLKSMKYLQVSIAKPIQPKFFHTDPINPQEHNPRNPPPLPLHPAEPPNRPPRHHPSARQRAIRDPARGDPQGHHHRLLNPVAAPAPGPLPP